MGFSVIALEMPIDIHAVFSRQEWYFIGQADITQRPA
jgi:hypothetical protein